MTEGSDPGLVERAHAAAARGGWQDAFDLLTAADADGVLGPADLPLLGEVAYAAGDLDVTIEAWERAHAACIQLDDQVAAAGAISAVSKSRCIARRTAAPAAAT